MKRTTTLLPDDLAALLEHERRCRDVSSAEIIRQVLTAYLTSGSTQPTRLPVVVLGRSGRRDTAGWAFLASLGQFDMVVPVPEDWQRIAQFVEQYGAFPLGGTDASIIALAERLNTDLVITLDRRHFAAVRPRHYSAFRLLPE